MPPVQQPSRADLTDAALQQRFIDDAPMEMSASGLTTGASPATPWWMWPLGLLGVAGVAGLVMRQRQLGSGVPSDILVLSRTAVSRSASLAVIEVTAADNTIRRLLVGVGGGAPRIVADLSSPAAAQEAAAAALEDAWMQPEEAPAPAKPAASAPAAVVWRRTRSRSRPGDGARRRTRPSRAPPRRRSPAAPGGRTAKISSLRCWRSARATAAKPPTQAGRTHGHATSRRCWVSRAAPGAEPAGAPAGPGARAPAVACPRAGAGR